MTPRPALSNAAPANEKTSASSPDVSVSAVSPDSPDQKRAFPTPASVPTQDGPAGVRFDFNDGCRVVVPNGGRKWRIRLSDIDTGNILFETRMEVGRVNSSKRYYVRYRVEVWADDEPLLTHEYSAKDRQILVQFPVGTLGDTLGWFPYAVKFQEKHGCTLTCAMADKLIPLFRDAYPEIAFVTHEQVNPEQFYATYSIGLFFDDADCMQQPCDFRLVGLHRTAGYILAVDPTEQPPRLGVPDEGRPIGEPYVCIAVQSSSGCKYWTNPHGWHDVVLALKARGYRVICIDQKPVHGSGLMWTQVPNGAEDETGDRPLAERVRWLRHAEFFVGLSSGLAWLAWAAGTEVVLISGFTHPTNEFTTPFRIINWHACNSCWNDPKIRFDHKDFLWCPRHGGTPRQFECTRLITSAQVLRVIDTIPQIRPTA